MPHGIRGSPRASTARIQCVVEIVEVHPDTTSNPSFRRDTSIHRKYRIRYPIPMPDSPASAQQMEPEILPPAPATVALAPTRASRSRGSDEELPVKSMPVPTAQAGEVGKTPTFQPDKPSVGPTSLLWNHRFTNGPPDFLTLSSSAAFQGLAFADLYLGLPFS